MEYRTFLTKSGKILTEEEIEKLADEAERGFPLFKILGHPEMSAADLELARAVAISHLRGTPRDHPNIGWDEALTILARAVLHEPKPEPEPERPSN